MALYYMKEGSREENIWHVGNDTRSLREKAHLVCEIQADGDELEAIRNQFDNLPIPKQSRVVSWLGNHAMFIAANIR